MNTQPVTDEVAVRRQAKFEAALAHRPSELVQQLEHADRLVFDFLVATDGQLLIEGDRVQSLLIAIDRILLDRLAVERKRDAR